MRTGFEIERAPGAAAPPSSEGVTVEPAREASEPSSEEAPRKPKRSRGRGRKSAKASAPPPEPVSVTWVQVGPGQFVRVEETQPPTDGGPDPSGAPVPESEKADSETTAVETPENDPVVAEAPSAHDTIPQPEQVASSETPEEPEVSETEAVAAESAMETQNGEPEPVEVATEPLIEPAVPDTETEADVVAAETVQEPQIGEPERVEAEAESVTDSECSESGTEELATELAMEPQIGEPEPKEVESEPVHEPEREASAVLEAEEMPPVAEAGSETMGAEETPAVVEEPESAATAPIEEPVEVEENVGGMADNPEPAIEAEGQAEAPEERSSALEGETDESETALADPEVGEGDLPQAGSFEGEGVESEGEIPEDLAPEAEERLEFDGESRTVFESGGSLAPTRSRGTTWPGWLPRSGSLRVRANVRGFEPAVHRPERVRSVPRAAERPRRQRSWHGALRYEPRAPPDDQVRRPLGMRRLAREIRSRGLEMPSAGQAA